jgi:hypothetical protein
MASQAQERAVQHDAAWDVLFINGLAAEIRSEILPDLTQIIAYNSRVSGEAFISVPFDTSSIVPRAQILRFKKIKTILFY